MDESLGGWNMKIKYGKYQSDGLIYLLRNHSKKYLAQLCKAADRTDVGKRAREGWNEHGRKAMRDESGQTTFHRCSERHRVVRSSVVRSSPDIV